MPRDQWQDFGAGLTALDLLVGVPLVLPTGLATARGSAVSIDAVAQFAKNGLPTAVVAEEIPARFVHRSLRERGGPKMDNA